MARTSEKFVPLCLLLLALSASPLQAKNAEEVLATAATCDTLANVKYKVKKSACCDTDKANDPNIKGTVFYASPVTGMEVKSKDDICTKNNTGVVQFVCEGQARSMEKYSACPYGCFNGRCVQPFCEDPDADVNPKDGVSSDLLIGSKVQVMFKGQLSDNQKDACVEGQAGKLIYEKFCSADNSKIATALVPCPSGHACKYDEEGEAYCKNQTPPPACTDLNKTPLNVFSAQGILFSMGGSETINKNNLCLSDPSAQEIMAKYFPEYAGKADNTVLDLTCLDLNKDGKDDIPGKPLAQECPVDHECQQGQCMPVKIKQTCADSEALAFEKGDAGSVTDKHYAGEIILTMKDISLPVQKDYCDPQDDWMLVELQCNAKGTEVALPIKQECPPDEICEAGKCVPLFVCDDEVPGPYGVSSEACPIGHMLRADEMATDDADDNGIYDSCEYPKLVSRSSDGEKGNGDSYSPGLSADGGKVIYESLATNLVDDDTNGKADIFLFDRKTHKTTRVNTKADGTEANNNSYITNQAIDACGRYAAFVSRADNLGEAKAECENQKIFVKEIKEGKLTEIKLPVNLQAKCKCDGTDTYCTHHPHISAEGSWLVLRYTPISNQDETWRVNLSTLEAEHVTDVSGYGFSLSHNGERLVFEVPGDIIPLPLDQNQKMDAYLYDIPSDQFTLLNVTPVGSTGNSGSGAPALSWNERWIAFDSTSTDLLVDGVDGPSSYLEVKPQVYLRDVALGTTIHIKPPYQYGKNPSISLHPALSANGRWIVWELHNGHGIGVYDRVTQESKLVSDELYGNWWLYSKLLAISADGRWIAFVPESDELVATFGIGANIFITYNPLWVAE